MSGEEEEAAAAAGCSLVRGGASSSALHTQNRLASRMASLLVRPRACEGKQVGAKAERSTRRGVHSRRGTPRPRAWSSAASPRQAAQAPAPSAPRSPAGWRCARSAPGGRAGPAPAPGGATQQSRSGREQMGAGGTGGGAGGAGVGLRRHGILRLGPRLHTALGGAQASSSRKPAPLPPPLCVGAACTHLHLEPWLGGQAAGLVQVVAPAAGVYNDLALTPRHAVQHALPQHRLPLCTLARPACTLRRQRGPGCGEATVCHAL